MREFFLTWIVPAGKFNYETVEIGGVSREIVVENSYHSVPSSPQSWHVFGSFLSGFQKQGAIIAFILIIGGAFYILNSSRSIDIGINSFLRHVRALEKNRAIKYLGVNNIVIVLTMILFSSFGAIFGMSEQSLAFVAIVIPLAISMGYDSITGFCMVYGAAHIGFSGAILNPFTIGIAQSIAGLQMFSGIEYRFVCWVLLTIIFIAIVLIYAAKVKKDPTKSVMYSADEYWRNRVAQGEIALEGESQSNASLPNEVKLGDAKFNNNKSSIRLKSVDTRSKLNKKGAWIMYFATSAALILYSTVFPQTKIEVGLSSFTAPFVPIITALYLLTGFIGVKKSHQYFIVNLFIYTILFLILGVLGYQWYLKEISALFLAMGVISGFAAGYGSNKIVNEFIEGCKEMLTPALIVGLAGGIIFILNDGNIIDTMLNSMAVGMAKTGKIVSLGSMYAIQTVLNIFIPSASAKAAITMPIMAPFSDVIGLSRQATIMAYQFGDGFTNMITPTSAVLIGALGIARIPYEVWVKWFYKFLIAFMILGFILLLPTVYMQLNGF
ncbi:MAG: AbgT family transporter [Bacteroidales bacterium]